MYEPAVQFLKVREMWNVPLLFCLTDGNDVRFHQMLHAGLSPCGPRLHIPSIGFLASLTRVDLLFSTKRPLCEHLKASLSVDASLVGFLPFLFFSF